MAKIEWEISQIDVDYQNLNATYSGLALVNGKEYTDVKSYDMTQAMLDSFKDPNMQQWQGFIDAVNALISGDYFWWIEDDLLKYEVPDMNNVPFVWRNAGSGNFATPDAAAEAVMKSYNDSLTSGYESYKAVSYQTVFSNDNKTLTVILKKADNSTTQIYTFAYVANPNYDPNAVPETVSLPFSEIINQIVLNTSSEDEAISLMAEAYMDEVARVFITPVFDDSVVPTGVPDYVCSISDGFINYQSKARERYTYIFDTPEFDAITQTILEQRMERQCEYLKLRDQMLDLDKSRGEALDLIGRLVGQQRTLINFIVDPYFGFLGARGAEAYNVGYWYTLNAASRGSVIVLSDELYRKVLRARIIKNGSNNNRQSLLGVLKALGESTPILIYKAHGVIEVQLTQENDPHGLISYFLSRVMRDDTIIPRQLGYRIGTRFISQE